MSLDYREQTNYDLIGSIDSNGIVSYENLLDHYYHGGVTTKSIKTVGFPQGELFGIYKPGTGETANSIQIQWESGPDNINWGRQVNDSTTDGTSSLTLREFTITQTTDYGMLGYDAQTVNFTAGDKLTGGTSSATAIIESDSDSGTTGTLTLSNVSGTFQDNETITDSDSGSATSNGILQSVTAFSIPLDLSSRWQRFSVKETDVSSNAGSIYLGITLSGR